MDPKELSELIADTVYHDLQVKFMKGQHEHGGDFALKPTVKNIREEVLDLVSYSHSLATHQKELVSKINELIIDLPGLNNEIIKLRLTDIKTLAMKL